MQLKFENHFGRQSGRSLNILNVEYFSVQLKTVIIKKKLKKKSICGICKSLKENVTTSRGLS